MYRAVDERVFGCKSVNACMGGCPDPFKKPRVLVCLKNVKSELRNGPTYYVKCYVVGLCTGLAPTLLK